MRNRPVSNPCTAALQTFPNALRRLFIVTSIITGATLLQACGGGADTQQQQPPPVVDTTAPSVPANLVATAASNSRIDLTWSASTDSGGSGLSGYRIYRDGSATALASVNSTATTYADSSLTAAMNYSYVVRAFDVAGNESASSTAAAATTQPAAPSANSGLDSRPSNAACLAWNRPNAGSTISLSRYTNLSFSSSLAMLQAPQDDAHWYVVEQGGMIKRFSASSPTTTTTFIDMTSRVTLGSEAGLLGMAFHPDFPTDKRVFLSYTTTVSGQLVSRISSFLSNDVGVTLDAASESIVLTVNQPESNHNGGNIAFDKDGYLYIGLGDGGGGGDVHGTNGNGQRLTTLLGKMLRIDIDAAAPYGIPSTNPYASNARCPAAGRTSGECPEIYASGLRNPWRWSFDRSNGELWLADVGQGAWEEVNKITLGGNYGWRCREGAHDFNSAGTPTCSGATLIDPVTEYSHSLGTSITGGYVYRGPQSTSLTGRYIFGDFGSGRIWAWIPENATQPREPTLLLESNVSIASFAQGNDGELFVVDYFGTLHRVIFQPGTGGGTIPPTLSASGCVSQADAKLPAEGLIPYDINAPFWSDGATKERWLALPNGSNITVQSNGDWNFPNGSVLMKNFRFGTRLIETRLFVRHPDGNWSGASYEWNAQQTDATLLQAGAIRDIGNGQQWIFPSESQCLECHTAAAGRSLGLETAQLNRTFTYAQTGRTANELFTLNHIGTLTPPITDPAAEPTMPDPTDMTAPLVNRARAYLHTNCSQCHRPNSPTPSNMDLRYTTPLNATNACNVVPQSGDLGLGANARLIAPGSAANSIVVNRTNRRDQNAMPPLGSNQVDTAGVALLRQWIDGLGTCGM